MGLFGFVPIEQKCILPALASPSLSLDGVCLSGRSTFFLPPQGGLSIEIERKWRIIPAAANVNVGIKRGELGREQQARPVFVPAAMSVLLPRDRYTQKRSNESATVRLSAMLSDGSG